MSEEARKEAQTDKQSKALVWAEIKPRLWAGAMSVLGFAFLACTAAAIVFGTGPMGISWAVGAAVSAVGAAFSWYEKEKAEKALLIQAADIESHVESQNWAKNFGMEKAPEQQQGLDNSPSAPAAPITELTESLLPPSQVAFASKFAKPDSMGISGDKNWADINPSKAGMPLATAQKDSFAETVADSLVPSNAVGATR
jgi:hypothetical protein